MGIAILILAFFQKKKQQLMKIMSIAIAVSRYSRMGLGYDPI